MKLDIIVRPNALIVKSDIAELDRINKHFSFTDKQVEHLLKRHDKAKHYRFSRGEGPEWQSRKEELEAKLQVFCGVLNDENLVLPIGLHSQLLQIAEGNVKDERDFDQHTFNLKGPMLKFRVPQREAFDMATYAKGGLIRMATGVGKTGVGQEIIRYFGVRSIFLVPSRPILIQTVDRFQSAFGRRNVGMYGDGKKKHNIVTVATYQSVYNSIPDDFSSYSLMIADEVHHIGADTFFECAQNRLTECLYRFGLTADEERADGGTILIEAAVGPCVYSYEVDQAIRDKYLAQPTFQVYEVRRTEGSYIEWKTKDKKREAIGELASEAYHGDDGHYAYKNWIVGNDLLTEKVAELANAFSQDKSVLILIDEKEHGEKLMRLLRNAEFVYGGGPNNDEILSRFNKRELPIIVATSTLGEGADTVPVDVLINLLGGTRPKQANGRALRNDPDENGVARKPTCLIIDFDYPNCSVLSRHSEMRSEVHECCGPVYRSRFV